MGPDAAVAVATVLPIGIAILALEIRASDTWTRPREIGFIRAGIVIRVAMFFTIGFAMVATTLLLYCVSVGIEIPTWLATAAGTIGALMGAEIFVALAFMYFDSIVEAVEVIDELKVEADDERRSRRPRPPGPPVEPLLPPSRAESHPQEGDSDRK